MQTFSATEQFELSHPNEFGALSPWELDFRQLDAGAMSTKIAVREGRNSSILNIATDRPVHQRGACPNGVVTFGIANGGTVMNWQGQELDRDAFLTFGNNDGFDGVTTEAFVGHVVSFDTAAFSSFAGACGYQTSGEEPATRVLQSEQSSRRMAGLKRRLVGALFDPHMPYDMELEASLMLDVLSILTDGELHEDKSDAQLRNRAVTRAIDLMHAHISDPLPIKELCRSSEASWRTLDRGFKDRFGCGPKAYYVRLRLTQVRLGLLARAPSELIAEIANRHGFWHMGQFADVYRRFFGELPSETNSKQK